MTKQWEIYEDTIKDLYAKHTLSTVRRIMIEKYGFKASTRAYRGRLVRWGMRKYNKRRDSPGSNDDASSGSEAAASPKLSPSIPDPAQGAAYYSGAYGNLGDEHAPTTDSGTNSYPPTTYSSSASYAGSYGSGFQNPVSYGSGWTSPMTHVSVSSSYADGVSAPAPYYASTQVTTAADPYSSDLVYISDYNNYHTSAILPSNGQSDSTYGYTQNVAASGSGMQTDSAHGQSESIYGYTQGAAASGSTSQTDSAHGQGGHAGGDTSGGGT
ncbi:hypothetical protein F4778DRAFT_536617 [Xylariomycetidae sp. FL2044]|nr:hypothetical protein F4778DRAFT_536617 [Xylariomycetidae sp. FL2044]